MTTLRQHYFPGTEPTPARKSPWSGSDVWVGGDSFLAARMADRILERRVREKRMTWAEAEANWVFGFHAVLSHLTEEQWRPQLEKLMS